MKKNSKHNLAITANLLASNDPAGRKARLRYLAKVVAARKQLLADVVECRKRAALAFTLAEQDHYLREGKKRQQQADNISRALRYLSQLGVDAVVAAAATAELL